MLTAAECGCILPKTPRATRNRSLGNTLPQVWPRYIYLDLQALHVEKPADAGVCLANATQRRFNCHSLDKLLSESPQGGAPSPRRHHGVVTSPRLEEVKFKGISEEPLWTPEADD